jgi:hypothetical protein
MELKENLIRDWGVIMTHIKKIAKAYPKFKVTVNPEKEIIINKDWKCIVHFINNEYVEAKVFFKDDEYLSVRHLESYQATVESVLFFIDSNLK